METPPLSSLYQQVILEHYRNPRNKAELEEKSVEIHMANPVCGDEVRLQLRIQDDQIEEAKFVGQGCSISQAAILERQPSVLLPSPSLRITGTLPGLSL